MIFAFLGRVTLYLQSILINFFFKDLKYPDFSRSKNTSSEEHTLINWNIQKGYNNLYRYSLHKTLYYLSKESPTHILLEEVQSHSQAKYIQHNLGYNDMIFFNGLCFLTNESIKSTLQIHLKSKGKALNIKIKDKKGSRDYYNIFLVHLTHDLSQTIQRQEMRKIIETMEFETSLEKERVILLGDFNLNNTEFDGELKEKFHIVNKINKPTYPYIYPILYLDRFYTNMCSNVSILGFDSSDHCAVKATLTLNP